MPSQDWYSWQGGLPAYSASLPGYSPSQGRRGGPSSAKSVPIPPPHRKPRPNQSLCPPPPLSCLYSRCNSYSRTSRPLLLLPKACPKCQCIKIPQRELIPADSSWVAAQEDHTSLNARLGALIPSRMEKKPPGVEKKFLGDEGVFMLCEV